MSSQDEMFHSEVRSAGDFAGVFEFDGDVAYFYLFDNRRPPNQKVLRSIQILDARPDFTESHISISWDRAETKVGLRIRGRLWAVFDLNGSSYGGNYRHDQDPEIPESIAEYFNLRTKTN